MEEEIESILYIAREISGLSWYYTASATTNYTVVL